MPEVWPVSLPQLVNEESFEQVVGPTTIRTDMDVGPAKVRRRFTKGVDTMAVGFTLTSAQVATLMEFFDINLNGGATTFYFNHPITGEQGIYRIVDTPSIRPLGGIHFACGMNWEKMP